MMAGDLLRSPFDILIIPAAMIMFFAVILIRMPAPGISRPGVRHEAAQRRRSH